MAPIISTLLATVGLSGHDSQAEDCLSCGRPLKSEEPNMRLPGGGHVHRGCATYRMRQNDRIRRQVLR